MKSIQIDDSDGMAALLYISERNLRENGKICQRPIRELDEKKHLVSDVKGMLSSDGYSVYELEIFEYCRKPF